MRILNISPIVRAVGVIGGVAALVTGVTFANLTSNTVALTPNNITTASAALVIDQANSCVNNSPTSTQGFTVTSLAPGASTTKKFCIKNKGTTDLSLSATIPEALGGSTAAVNTTLGITCTNGGGTFSTVALNTYNSTQSAAGSNLAAGATAECTATATLSGGYGGVGGEPIPTFTIEFVGSQVVLGP